MICDRRFPPEKCFISFGEIKKIAENESALGETAANNRNTEESVAGRTEYTDRQSGPRSPSPEPRGINLNDYIPKGKRKHSASQASVVTREDQMVLQLPDSDPTSEFSIPQCLAHNRFQAACYQKFLEQYMDGRLGKYASHKEAQENIEKLIKELQEKRKSGPMKQKQTHKGANQNDLGGAVSQGEITGDTSFQLGGGGKGLLEQIFGSGLLGPGKNFLGPKQHKASGEAPQDLLNDTLANQKSLQDEDDEDLESPTAKQDEPNVLSFGDKLASFKKGQIRNRDDPEEIYKVPADLGNNSAIRMIAGFADHMKLVEAANKNMFSYQFTVKNKTETHPPISPAARENLLMLVVKPGLVASHIIVVGGIGSDITSSFDLYSLQKRRWEFVQPELSQVPGATTFKIYGHRGEYYEGCVYFFGGYVAISHSFSKYLSNELYCFNMESKELTRIPTSAGGRIPRPRIGHATVVYANFMVVMGGRGESYNIRSDFWIVGLKLKPMAKTTDKFAFTWAKLDILGSSGDQDQEFADLCYHTLTHIPKCKEAPGFANHVEIRLT